MPHILTIKGDFDAACVEKLRSELDHLADADTDIVIDLALSQFLDSSGIGAIVFLYKRARARGYDVTLRNAAGQPLKLLQHLGIASLLAEQAPRAA